MCHIPNNEKSKSVSNTSRHACALTSPCINIVHTYIYRRTYLTDIYWNAVQSSLLFCSLNAKRLGRGLKIESRQETNSGALITPQMWFIAYANYTLMRSFDWQTGMEGYREYVSIPHSAKLECWCEESIIDRLRKKSIIKGNECLLFSLLLCTKYWLIPGTRQYQWKLICILHLSLSNVFWGRILLLYFYIWRWTSEIPAE